MKTAYSSRHVAILILLVATVAVAGLVILKSRPADNGGDQSLVDDIISRLTTSYERQAEGIITTYLTSRRDLLQQGSVDDDATARQQWATLAGTAKTDLLALRVPEDYRDVHLQLVLLFTGIENSAASDLTAVQTADNQLDALITQYPWLVADLALRQSL